MPEASVWCFIFARGGSKGLPGKNLLELDGKPLLAHSILLAKKINGVSRIIVSTDSHDIAQQAEYYGAEVPFIRPSHLAEDESSEWSAWQHALQWFKDKNCLPELFLSLPTTSPLRSVGDVNSCIDLCNDDTDIVITTTPARRNPWFNMVTIDKNKNASLINGSEVYHCRQKAPEVYDMSTVAYVAKPEYILSNEHLFSGRVKSVIIPSERAVDIDTDLDFKWASFLMNNK